MTLRSTFGRTANTVSRGLFRIFAGVLLVLSLALPVPAVMVGTRHDFVDNGFPGGVCSECHTPHFALDSSLYPRLDTTAGVPDVVPRRLCLDCHNATLPANGTMPAGFPVLVPAVVPPGMPATHAGGTGNYVPCTGCHLH
jgi:hypothetical protein